MGSAENDINASGDEFPQHTVYLDAYWMDQTEVTNAKFAAFLNQQGNQTEGGVGWLDAGDTDALIVQSGSMWIPKSGYEEHPVVEVSWYGAQAYCAWAGRRLPTEAEWEKAARGGLEGATYPWGNEAPVCTRGTQNGAQFDSCSGRTMLVGTFAANGYGLFDMAGNIWEWVMDWYQSNYYANSPSNNPQGPSVGDRRVLRGGSWNGNINDLRVGHRFRYLPSNPYYGDRGFRCALSP
jgi:formylglycine-generating enzyme required for sulfatase activity